MNLAGVLLLELLKLTIKVETEDSELLLYLTRSGTPPTFLICSQSSRVLSSAVF